MMKRPLPVIGFHISSLLFAFISACSPGDDAETNPCPEGTLGCSCISSTLECNTGLVCQGGVCINPLATGSGGMNGLGSGGTAAGGPFGSGGAMSSGGTGGSGGLGSGGESLSGSGGMDTGSGGVDMGSGGMAMGSGGMAMGSGGMAMGSGGMDMGSGGMDMGSGGMGMGGMGGSAASCEPVSCNSNIVQDVDNGMDGCFDLPARGGMQMSNCHGCTLELDGVDISDQCSAGHINNLGVGDAMELYVSDCDHLYVSFSCWGP